MRVVQPFWQTTCFHCWANAAPAGPRWRQQRCCHGDAPSANQHLPSVSLSPGQMTTVVTWRVARQSKQSVAVSNRWCVVKRSTQLEYADKLHHLAESEFPLSFRRPHSGTSSSISYSPIPSRITSLFLFYSPLCTSITPSLFHSRLKTYLFHKSYPVVSLLPPGLPPRTIGQFLLSYSVFDFICSLFSFLCCALD